MGGGEREKLHKQQRDRTRAVHSTTMIMIYKKTPCVHDGTDILILTPQSQVTKSKLSVSSRLVWTIFQGHI